MSEPTGRSAHPDTSEQPGLSEQSGEPGAGVFDWVDQLAARRASEGTALRLYPREPGDDTIDLAGRDYLATGTDKRVTSAAAAAALKWGAGARGPRPRTGTTELHAELERELAAYAGTEAALVFASGYTANLDAITALSGKECAIVADRYIHPSCIDACRQAHAQVAVVEHADPAAAAHALATRKTPRALVVTESVFDFDGTTSPLPGLHAACREHGAALLVDVSAGFGVLGDGGLAEAGLGKAPDVVATTSLGAALGAQGGAVLGPRRVITHLVNNARTMLFEVGLNPPAAGAALAALRIAGDEPERAEIALARAAALAEGLRAAELDASTPAAVTVTVPVDSAATANAWAARLRQRSVAVEPVWGPAAPDGVARLRMTAHAGLSEPDVETTVRAIADTAPRR